MVAILGFRAYGCIPHQTIVYGSVARKSHLKAPKRSFKAYFCELPSALSSRILDLTRNSEGPPQCRFTNTNASPATAGPRKSRSFPTPNSPSAPTVAARWSAPSLRPPSSSQVAAGMPTATAPRNPPIPAARPVVTPHPPLRIHPQPTPLRQHQRPLQRLRPPRPQQHLQRNPSVPSTSTCAVDSLVTPTHR